LFHVEQLQKNENAVLTFGDGFAIIIA
jgi:hypothetical protein